MSNEKQYADRDIMDLDEKGGYYFRHVDAMTGESLHGKSDIAAELGHRDMLIDTYRDLCVELLELMRVTMAHIDECFEKNKNASKGITPTIIRNVGDAIKKSESIIGENNAT